jgi:hypothetical protein
MVGEILVIAYLVLLSTVKFLFVPFLSIHVHNFNYITAVLINVSGGIIGISVFFKTSTYFIERAIKKRHEALAKGVAKPKRIFTRVNRFLVQVKNTMGMYGLAFIILPFLSIPISSIVSAKYFHLKKKKMLFLLYLSSIIWSFLLSGIALLF